jgi:hypothetical protein
MQFTAFNQCCTNYLSMSPDITNFPIIGNIQAEYIHTTAPEASTQTTGLAVLTKTGFPKVVSKYRRPIQMLFVGLCAVVPELLDAVTAECMDCTH